MTSRNAKLLSEALKCNQKLRRKLSSHSLCRHGQCRRARFSRDQNFKIQETFRRTKDPRDYKSHLELMMNESMPKRGIVLIVVANHPVRKLKIFPLAEKLRGMLMAKSTANANNQRSALDRFIVETSLRRLN